MTAALATRPGLLVIDAGAVRDSSSVPRSQQVNALDSRIQLVVGALPAGATVLLASLADSGPSDHLQLLATTGLDGEPTGRPAGALLTDGSGGQDGVARLVDLTPTLLHALGVAPPASLPGSALRSTGPTGDLASRLERMVDLDRADRAVRTEAGRFLLGLVVLQLALFLGALLVLRRPPVPPAAVPSRVRILRTLRWCAVGASALPAAGLLAGLIPWWRESGPGLAAVVAVATFWLPLTGLALLGPWRSAPLGPAAAVGGLTALVATAAAVTGPRMSSAGLLRLQDLLDSAITPAAGIAGPRTTLLGAGAALAATGAAALAPPRRRRAVAVAAVAAIGALAVVVTAAVGGAPGESPEGNLAAGLALLPAFGVLLAATTGHRAAARSLFVLLAAGLVLAALPVAAHGWRVVEADRAALTLPITWLLPVAAGFVALVLGRPTGWGVTPLTAAVRRIPVLGAGLAAFALWLAPTLAVLPGGPALAGLACGFVVPLLVAAVARVLELEAVDDLDAAVTAVRRQGHGRGRSPRVAGRPAAGPPSTAR